MSSRTWQEPDLLAAIRAGDAEAWSYLIDRYQGRLLRYVQARSPKRGDAQDLVQDTFVAFIRGLPRFRGDCTIETYLFVLLRHAIINHSRSRWVQSLCLLQDIVVNRDDPQADVMATINDPDAGVSRCVSLRENHDYQFDVLAKTFKDLVAGFKRKLNFRNLKIIDVIFYAGLSSSKAAQLLDVNEGIIRVLKHRCLRQVQQAIVKVSPTTEGSFHCADDLIHQVWESQRLTCPKRSTLGAFLLQELEPAWFEYVDFHLATLGCHFCRANFKDLQQQQGRGHRDTFQQQIMASTVGFLTGLPNTQRPAQEN